MRPSVDLPQPDSPTRPTVSPRRTSRSTPSTAWSWPVVRLRKPCLTGKYFLRPRTAAGASPIADAAGLSSALLDAGSRPLTTRCRSGSSRAAALAQPARRLLRRRPRAAGGSSVAQRVEGVVAARREPAAARPVERARHHAADRLERRRVAHPEQRDRRSSASVYGCCGLVEDLVHGAALDDLAGVHHGDLVDHLRDHAEVVGDQEDRHPELLAQVLHQLEDLRLHGDVERGGRLVGDQELGVAARAPSRSSRAGACRPTAGAGSRASRFSADGDADEPHHLERPRFALPCRRRSGGAGPPRRSGRRP